MAAAILDSAENSLRLVCRLYPLARTVGRDLVYANHLLVGPIRAKTMVKCVSWF